MRSRHQQSGLTLIGFIFVAVVVVAVALLGFRMAPAYIEYFSVVKILKQMMNESSDNVTLTELRKNFDRRAGADYIDSVHGNDIELSKDGNTITATANWTTTLPLVANVSLLIDFQASASK
jgi:hypothetical protein